MFVTSRLRLSALALLLLLGVALFPATSTNADHSWGNYHWARTSSSFTLKLGDNLDNSWDSYLKTASSDWSKSSVLDTTVVNGQAKGKNCRPPDGRAEVCNDRYGNNGWLGVAQIWASGSHIVKGVVKVNDTYFSQEPYNSSEWKTMVMCQEVGHVFGLDHQDENFDNNNLGTCMDYTSDPSTNQHPNQHDYDQLEIIYEHLDDTSTVSSVADSNFGRNMNLNDAREWGKAVHHKGGKADVYVREFGPGQKIFTFVVWAR